MSAAREHILNRIRGATRANPDERLEACDRIPRDYAMAGTRSDAARLELFTQRLRDYEATVYECKQTGIATAIFHALQMRAKTRLLIPAGIPSEWRPEGIEFPQDDQASHEQLDQVQGVLTGCTVAIALTGTIVLQHKGGEGRRALTLIPDYHLCVVLASQVVETVPEGIRRLEDVAGSPLTMISGPSATSDIEMTRVKGVHGPRVLDVILVDG